MSGLKVLKWKDPYFTGYAFGREGEMIFVWGMQVTAAKSVSIEVRDEVWSEGPDEEFKVRIYRDPSIKAPQPSIIDVHGGAWCSLDRTAGEYYDRAMAGAGFLVAAIDFHQGPMHQHPSASQDVAGSVRWLRLNAVRLGIDSNHIGLVGSSSGGHLAILASMLPNAPMHQGSRIKMDGRTATADASISPGVSYVIALWPVSDPFFRYRYAKRTGMAHLARAQEAYFGTEETMRAASVTRVVTAGEAEQLVPLLIVQPGEDANVPVEMTFDLMKAWQGREGYVEYAFFPGLTHGFGHREGPSTEEMIALMIDFARRKGGIKDSLFVNVG